MPQNTTAIIDINFRPLQADDLEYIKRCKRATKFQQFIKRTIFSAIVFVCAAIFEVVARALQNEHYGYEFYSIDAAIIAFIVIFALFTVASVIIYLLSGKLSEVTEDISIVDAQIVRLLGKKQLKKEAADSYAARLEIWKNDSTKSTPKPKLKNYAGFEDSSSIPDYLFFKCDQGECSTAIHVKDRRFFNSLSVGEDIKVVKTTSNDVSHYDVYRLN